MMTILEGGNYPNQGHIHCKWRDNLIQMLEEFGQSYRVLAIAYNQLKSKTSDGIFHSGSLSSSTASEIICANCSRRGTGNLEDKKLKEHRHRHLKSTAEHSDVKFDGTNMDFELLKKQEDDFDELLSSDPCSMKFISELEHSNTQLEDKMTDFSTNENILVKNGDLELNKRNEDPSMTNSKFDSNWPVLKYQMTKLAEDNMHQLVERPLEGFS